MSIGTRHRGDAEKHDERKQDGAEKAKDSQGDHGKPRPYAIAANLARPLFSYPARLRPVLTIGLMAAGSLSLGGAPAQPQPATAWPLAPA